MIQALLLGLAILVLWLLAANWYASASPRQIKRTLLWVGVVLLVALIVVLALSGRLAWALGALGGLIAWVMRFVRFGLALRALQGLFGMGAGQASSGGASGGGGGPRPGAQGPMTEEEAWRVLGLEPGASEAAIHDAYRRLMAKVHPDTGGSDYLATKLNQARDVLLKR